MVVLLLLLVSEEGNYRARQYYANLARGGANRCVRSAFPMQVLSR